MIRNLLTLFFYVFTIQLTIAQIEKTKNINMYTVSLNTTKGNINGILLQATDTTILVEVKGKEKVVPVTEIKKLKIKFATPVSYKIYIGLAQAGIDIIANPPNNQTSYNYGGQSSFESIQTEEETLAEYGGRVLVGTALTGTAMAANELTKLIYRPNIQVFKIKKDGKRYIKDMKEEILWYTLYFQQSPDYEAKQLEQLKNVMKKVKPRE